MTTSKRPTTPPCRPIRQSLSLSVPKRQQLTLLATNHSEPEQSPHTFDSPLPPRLLALVSSSSVIVLRPPPPDRAVILCHVPLHTVDTLERDRLRLRGRPPCRPPSPLPNHNLTARRTPYRRTPLRSVQSIGASSIATYVPFTHVGQALLPTSLSRLLAYDTTPRATVDDQLLTTVNPSLGSSHLLATGDRELRNV